MNVQLRGGTELAAIIKDVLRGSIGEELEIEPGDILIKIDGHEINDILDYQFYSQEDIFTLEIKKKNDEVWEIEIEKDYDEDLGLLFDGLVFDRMKSCKNRCIFCFIDQLPRNMRKTMYVKDDDYRYSFLYGNFITLTNLTEADWEKIVNMHLSPLYVSVHCMKEEIRASMLNNPRGKNINSELQRLKEAGIEVHTQIVLCPGINDGEMLEYSIEKLATHASSVMSVGIVPVGLSGHREKLKQLKSVDKNAAVAVVRMIENYQEEFRNKWGRGFVYLADEFYLQAGIEIPDAEYYDDYCQLENGIGLCRLLLDEFQDIEKLLPEKISPREVCIITGISALPLIEKMVKRLNLIDGVNIEILPVKNNFFGGEVSVTGLLTGQDIIAALADKYAGKRVIIPEIVCRDGQDVLLDDISLTMIREKSGADIKTVDGTAQSLVETILS